MSLFKRLLLWEKRVERQPKVYLARLIATVFVGSLFTGFLVSQAMQNQKQGEFTRMLEKMQTEEATRMEKQIEQLQIMRTSRG